MSAIEDREIRGRIGRIESLIQEIERFANPTARALAQELVQALLDFHGAGLARLLDGVAAAGEPGRSIIAALARDDLVGSMLLLYGLHPLDLEARLQQALEKVRPYLRSHGGDVEFLGVLDGTVRLRMQGSCHGCPSSAMTLKLAIEEAIYEAAPDVAAIEVEGVVDRPPGPPPGFVPSDQLRGGNGAAHPVRGGWEEVDDLKSLPEGTVQAREVVGQPVLFCRVGGTLYAYATTCPDCGELLDRATLSGTYLTCASCGQGFDVLRAGRGREETSPHLEPFPLLVEHDHVKVALFSS